MPATNSKAYTVDDIANVLRSLNQAGGGTSALVRQLIADCERQGSQPDMRELEEKLRLYQGGYYDALGAVALAFGIEKGER